MLAMPLEKVDAIVAWHNVAGEHGVLNAAAQSVADYVQGHYTARAIDHIPYTTAHKCYVLTPDPPKLNGQASYRQQLSGMVFQPINSFNDIPEHERALFLPYIRITDIPSERSLLRYGLPPQVTTALKDKVALHQWMMTHDMQAYIPNFIGCRIADIPEQGLRMLEAVTAMHDVAGTRGTYPVGVVLRSAYSDGNFAMALVIEATEDFQSGEQSVSRGQFILKPDGKTASLQVFDDARLAFEAARDHLYQANDTTIDDRVVMTRWIDVRVSPGLCTAVTGTTIHTFPFNGQYMEPGHTACTGTMSFAAAVGEAFAEDISTAHLAQAQHLLTTITQQFCGQDEIYAMLNIDGMVVGELEKQLWEQAPQFRDRFGFDEAYQPRAYDPSKILLAEVNPRDTNWTLAMKAVLQANHLPCTIENLQALANGQGIQVLARDHWHLPPQMSIEEAREKLLDYHAQLAEDGEGFIMRMPDSPAGVIIFSPTPGRVHQIARAAYDFLTTR